VTSDIPCTTTNLRDVLRQHGLRYSKPRALMLAYFQERDRHVSAEALHQDLRARGYDISLSTVYLNLSVLSGASLIRELAGSGGEALYDGNVAPHHHLICRACGLVVDLPLAPGGEALWETALRQHAQVLEGWQLDAPHLDIMGCCPDCAPAQNGAS
jgi:Fur family transcriptional regulator, peroxide stress response regulator